VLLSLKEGSNRALFEGMFAGTPAILLEKNIGVNKDYINEKTGKLVKERELAESIIHFKKYWQSYDPRSWAMNNISPEKTTEKLVAAINYIDKGVKFTLGDIDTKVNQPEVGYFTNKLDKDALIDSILHIFTKNRPNGSGLGDFFAQKQFALKIERSKCENNM